MKRTLTLLSLMLITAVSMMAQSLNGTWKSMQQDDEGQTINLYMTFASANSLEFKVSAVIDDPEVGSFTIVANMKGTYKRTGNRLTLNVEPKSSTVKMENVNWSPDVKKAINTSPEVKTAFDAMLKEQLENAKGEMTKEVPFGEEMSIKSLTANKLILHSDIDDEDLVFTRISVGGGRRR